MKIIFKNRNQLQKQSKGITYNHCILDIILPNEKIDLICNNDNCVDMFTIILSEDECIEEYKEMVKEFLLNNINVDYIYVSDNKFTKNILNEIMRDDICNFVKM